jgi:hypothetical protein
MAQPVAAPVSPVFLPLQLLLIGIDLLVSGRFCPGAFCRFAFLLSTNQISLIFLPFLSCFVVLPYSPIMSPHPIDLGNKQIHELHRNVDLDLDLQMDQCLEENGRAQSHAFGSRR